MYKVIIVTIIICLFSIQSGYALELSLKSIDIESQEAVLIDKDTGEEWIVIKGDNIEGWIVDEITENSVVIIKLDEGSSEGIARTLTLPKIKSITPVRR
jgi:hypothetical protein